MSLLIAVKVFGDLCFYFAVLGAFPGLFPHSLELIWPALLCGLGAGTASWLQEKHGRVWFAAVLFPLASFGMAHGWGEVLILAPAVLYACMIICRGLFLLDYHEYRETFLHSLIIWAVVFFICFMLEYIVITSGENSVFNYRFMLRFGAVYGLTGVFLLRQLRLGTMLRGDTAVNIAELLLVTAAVFLVSGGARFLLVETARPNFELMLGVIGGGIMKLFSARKSEWTQEQEILESMTAEVTKETSAQPPILQETAQEIVTQAEKTGGSFPWWLVALLMVLLLIFILWKMMKPFLKGVGASSPASFGEASSRARPAAGPFLSNREKIRRCYRDFQKLLRKRGVVLRPDQTSEDILRIASAYVSPSSAAALREVYICARYDDRREVTEEQVRQARKALKELNRSRE